jgi:hypothetical protein
VFLFSTKESDLSKPLADAYVSKLFADTNYGASTVLKVNSGENTNIALMSFDSAAIDGSNHVELSLPTLNDASMDVKLSVISDLTIDESTVTYNNVKDELSKAVYLGEYTVTEGDVKLDLTDYIAELGASKTFTLVIEAADEVDNVLNIDFEEYVNDYVVPGNDTKYITGMHYTDHNGDLLASNGYLTVRGYNSPYSYGAVGDRNDKNAFTVKQFIVFWVV